MAKKKTTPQHGGARENAGRKAVYNEQTVTVAFRVPESKKELLQLIVKKQLAKWIA